MSASPSSAHFRRERTLYWLAIAVLGAGWAWSAWRGKSTDQQHVVETSRSHPSSPALSVTPGLAAPTGSQAASASSKDSAAAEVAARFIETGQLDTITLPSDQTHLLSGDFFQPGTLTFDPARLALELDPATQASVETAFATALHGFLESEKSRARLDTDAEGNQSLVLPPAPEEHRQISQDFRRALTEALGPTLAWTLSQPYTRRWFPGTGDNWMRLWIEAEPGNEKFDIGSQQTIRDTATPADDDIRQEDYRTFRIGDPMLEARYGHLFPAAKPGAK